jgi:hydroxymethylpyrimidine kinase/phosphomethylpyrimidine kinase/thiamine-phosphate diphosphorylase
MRRLDLYAIVDSADRLEKVLAAGVRTVQLRIKTPEQPDATWQAMLRTEIQRSVAACAEAGAELFINDHWQLAAEAGAGGVHLGQEDLLALGEAGRAALQATGMALGISSHSLWELCRARTLDPRYIACGPVWPTLTKAMPWRPQGLDNLAWWCRMAGVPVVAIGGILGAEEVLQASSCGADGICIVRGLGERPQDVLPALQQALAAGRRAPAPQLPASPHPSLAPA